MNIFLHNICEKDPQFPNTLKEKSNAKNVYVVRDDQRDIYFDLDSDFIINISELDGENIPSIKYSLEDLGAEFNIMYQELHSSLFTKYAMQYTRMHISSTIFDAEHSFRMQFLYFCDFFIKKDINLFVASCDFARGWEYLAYYICKKLNIRTILVLNDVGDRFFYVEDIEDYGVFNTALNIFDKTLMVDISKDDINFNPDFNSKNPVFYNMFGFKEIFYLFIRIIYMFLFKGMNRFYDSIIYFHNIKKITIFRKNFNKLISSLSVVDDLNKKFIYFPMHLQPEASSTTRCGIFEDQVLVVEILANLFPEYLILIKDNYNQENMARRSAGFYERIKRLGNVLEVSPSMDSQALISRSNFVAVINGTAGWESLFLNKRVITFGSPFYKSAPFVTCYCKDFNRSDFLLEVSDGIEFNKKLQIWISEISKKMGYGNVIPAYIDRPSAFTNYQKYQQIRLRNSNYVATSISHIIKREYLEFNDINELQS
jgi:hypothetical protein